MDAKYKFEITYQGSSTLMYGVKNFELGATPYVEDETSYTILWTPDSSKFKPEQSFTLKADVVDSSHSNNVIVGKFVNDYMKNSALADGCKTCLEGFPVLLFMRDNISGASTSNNTLFLGIYSFNLGRNSVYNLGYKKLDDTKCTDITAEATTSLAKAYLLNSSDAISHGSNYRVAEVQGNSTVLYDYS